MVDLLPCLFCKCPHALLDGDAVSRWAYCTRCFARGPAVLKERPDCEAQARAAWNSPHDALGSLGIALVPGGMPAVSAAIARRLELIAEGILRGEHGAPDGAVLVLRAGGVATVSHHNVLPADAMRLLVAVTDAARARAGAAISLPHALKGKTDHG